MEDELVGHPWNSAFFYSHEKARAHMARLGFIPSDNENYHYTHPDRPDVTGWIEYSPIEDSETEKPELMTEVGLYDI